MAACELCGKPATTKAKVEGALLTVCASCASYGKEIKAPPARPLTPSAPRRDLPETYLAGDAGTLLRQARQRLKLTEEEAAKRLNIKESTLRHFEAGSLQPDDVTARKLEKFFGVSLLRQL